MQTDRFSATFLGVKRKGLTILLSAFQYSNLFYLLLIFSCSLLFFSCLRLQNAKYVSEANEVLAAESQVNIS